MPLNCHGGVGGPSYYPHPSSALIQITELGNYSRRPLIFMLLSGVFERFPKLKFVMTEQGCAWIPPFLAQMDDVLARVKKHGAIGELRFKPEHILPKSATEYFQQNVWLGVSFPGPADARAAKETVGLDKFMWGSDYPHDEGTYPFSREALRQVFSDWSPADMQKHPHRQRRQALRLRRRRVEAARRPVRADAGRARAAVARAAGAPERSAAPGAGDRGLTRDSESRSRFSISRSRRLSSRSRSSASRRSRSACFSALLGFPLVEAPVELLGTDGR